MQRNLQKLKDDLAGIMFFPENDFGLDVLVSALTHHNHFYSTEELTQHITQLNARQVFTVKVKPLADLKQWFYDRVNGRIHHQKGAFFTIEGMRISSNISRVKRWYQPIILQPEIGILGYLTKKFNGILHFLVQIKAEPGNINTYQLSPTVQATRSNYLRKHGGKPTRYLEYFNGGEPVTVCYDRYQSEQGTRFFQKRNRNVIVFVDSDEEIEEHPGYRWMTLGQILHFNRQDNRVNMDTRSVISNLFFTPLEPASRKPVNGSALQDAINSNPLVHGQITQSGLDFLISAHPNTPSRFSDDQIVNQLTRERYRCELEKGFVHLEDMREWDVTNEAITRADGRFFSVIGVDIFTDNREVSAWDQPIVRQHHSGLIGLLTRHFDGIAHFLVQFQMECGLIDSMELAPSLQAIFENYPKASPPPFHDLFRHTRDADTLTSAYQSEEGGRFFREQNRNMLIRIDHEPVVPDPSRFTWVTLGQLKRMLRFPSVVNVELRSILSMISFTEKEND